jgi:NADPH:quinone reductase-like Zn-dependent oxidoreductase
VTDPVRTMRAMRASNSDPASLTSQRVPVPDPGPGELLVEVRATAVTAGELTWPESWPAIPCHDLSGVVAALAGARVTATASARDLDFVAGLGASDVLDYSGRFEEHVHDVDVVIDPVGGATTARSWPVLRSGGTLVAIAEEPDPSSGGRDDVRSVYFVVRPDGTQLRELARLIDHAQLRPVVSAVFDLGELPDAFLAKRGDRLPGKVVISVREDSR